METNRATTELPIATRVGLIETLARELWITQVDITKSKDEREKELRDVTGKAVKRPSDAAVQSLEHFAAGVAVNSLGYNNKEIIKAVKKQANQGIHIGFSDFYCEKPVEFIEKLLEFVPKNLQKV